MWSGRARLDPAVVQGFYDRMRIVAPSGAGAIGRDARRRPVGRPFPQTACGRLVASLDGAGLRALGMWVHHWCLRCYDDDTRAALRLIEEIAGRTGLGWTVDEVHWMLGETHATPYIEQGFRLPVAAAAELGPAALPTLRPEIEAILDWLDSGRSPYSPAARRRIARQLWSVVRGTGQVPDPLPAWLLPVDERFGAAARERHGDLLRRPGVVAVLTHAVTLSRVEPTARWLRAGRAAVAESPDARPLIRGLLELFTEQEEESPHGDEDGGVLHPNAETLLRGLLWLMVDTDQEWVTTLLAAVTVHAATASTDAPGFPRCPRLANAAVLALSRRAGVLPVVTLARLSGSVRNRALLNRVRVALTGSGAARGWSPEEVLELSVADHGLDAAGRRVAKIGGYEAVVEIEEGRAVLRFVRDGRPLKGVPAVVRADHPGELADLRSLVRDVGASLTAERGRIESLLSTDRVWSTADWMTRYLDQPVTGFFGRRLIWQTEVGRAGWVSGWPRRTPSGWVLVALDGMVLPTGGPVRLWHPLRVAADEVRAWRDRIVAWDLRRPEGLRQPVRQAFREVYQVTPMEQETRFHSTRFVGHLLHHRQAHALMRSRGWAATHLGPWDGGLEGEAVREFGAWRVRFFHVLEADPDGCDQAAWYCCTGQIRFDRRDGSAWQPMPVTGVPPLVFSEAMRDVDLFVTVTSIAADPQCWERGSERFRSYRAATAVGPLTASGEVRREVLSRLLPRTRIADRVELGPCFLRVRGNRGTYRIHLGSGAVLVEPDGGYLRVVGDRRPATPHLPFDEDPVLSEVLSKAFLLAADDQMVDGQVTGDRVTGDQIVDGQVVGDQLNGDQLVDGQLDDDRISDVQIVDETILRRLVG